MIYNLKSKSSAKVRNALFKLIFKSNFVKSVPSKHFIHYLKTILIFLII